MTDPRLVVPSGTIVDVRITPGPPGTVVYDYGILRAEGPRTLHCPCGRTDKAGRAVDVITAHLPSAPVGTQAAILVRAMASDGTTGTAYLYAVAERGNDTIIWPTYQGIRAPPSTPPSLPPATSVTEARIKSAAPPDRVGRPQDPGSTTIVRTV